MKPMQLVDLRHHSLTNLQLLNNHHSCHIIHTRMLQLLNTSNPTLLCLHTNSHGWLLLRMLLELLIRMLGQVTHIMLNEMLLRIRINSRIRIEPPVISRMRLVALIQFQ